MRRHFNLHPEDEEELREQGHEWETLVEGSASWLLIPNYQLPAGFNVERACLAIQLPPSYPDTQIDMVYFHPALALRSTKTIGALSTNQLDGRQFQRWSRHRTAANPWRPGHDRITTHLLLVDTWLAREMAP